MNNLHEALLGFTHGLNLDRYLSNSQLASLLGVVVAVALPLFAGLSLAGNHAPGPITPPAVTLPLDPDRGVEDESLKSTLFLSTAEVRGNAGLGPLGMDVDKAARAQAIAEQDARRGAASKDHSNKDSVILQASLPYDQATAGNVMQGFIKDEASHQQLASSTVSTLGIGVASANGTTWVVFVLG